MRARRISLCGALFGLSFVAHAAPPPPPDGASWAPIATLSDEFDGDRLSLAKWQVGPNFDSRYGWRGRAPSAFSPENVSVLDGALRLKTTSRASRMEQVRDPRREIWIDAACVRSIEPATYGYYEARIKAARLISTSSFWMQGKFSEIDVTENVGVSAASQNGWKSSDMHSSTHYFKWGWRLDRKTTAAIAMSAPTTEWHTYGVWWKDARTVQFYLDGRLASVQRARGDFHEGMHVFFDTEVFAGQGYPTIENMSNPERNTMLVDWVRAYRLVPGR